MQPTDPAARIARLRDGLSRVREQIARVIVGMPDVVDLLLVALLCDGHVLLEGPPGLGKTLLVKSLASSLDLGFGRVQCTPDLMPSDVVGAVHLSQAEPGSTPVLRFEQGPVFTNVLLLDEINRATPKTQSALLEAMEERRVTAAGETRGLPDPFLVLATQNPIEMEGTYPLPEAQLDRFLLKVLIPRPGVDDLMKIVERTTGTEDSSVDAVLGTDALDEARALVRAAVLPPALLRRIARFVLATHPDGPDATPDVRRLVRYGASPRGARALALAAKAKAILEGRPHVSSADLSALALPAMRHRLLLSFEAEAEGIDAEQVLRPLLTLLEE